MGPTESGENVAPEVGGVGVTRVEGDPGPRDIRFRASCRGPRALHEGRPTRALRATAGQRPAQRNT
jgi:hypothetical protein